MGLIYSWQAKKVLHFNLDQHFPLLLCCHPVYDIFTTYIQTSQPIAIDGRFVSGFNNKSFCLKNLVYELTWRQILSYYLLTMSFHHNYLSWLDQWMITIASFYSTTALTQLCARSLHNGSDNRSSLPGSAVWRPAPSRHRCGHQDLHVACFEVLCRKCNKNE